MSSKLLYKWCIGLLTKPLTIFRSIYYRLIDKHKNIARLNICKRCVNKEHTSFGDVCSLCGCILDNKTRIKEEHCELNKW